MKHFRKDYDRIQDPAVEKPELLAPGTTAIGKDEPVFIIRGKDKLMIPALRCYYVLAKEVNSDVAKAVIDGIELVKAWQTKNNDLVKIPDMPPHSQDPVDNRLESIIAIVKSLGPGSVNPHWLISELGALRLDYHASKGYTFQAEDRVTTPYWGDGTVVYPQIDEFGQIGVKFDKPTAEDIIFIAPFKLRPID